MLGAHPSLAGKVPSALPFSHTSQKYFAILDAVL
jgi:hypothetical protein